ATFGNVKRLLWSRAARSLRSDGRPAKPPSDRPNAVVDATTRWVDWVSQALSVNRRDQRLYYNRCRTSSGRYRRWRAPNGSSRRTGKPSARGITGYSGCTDPARSINTVLVPTQVRDPLPSSPIART